jgi:large subunit ribosomal protein L10e
MAKLRRFRAYRNIERPYTRVSKFKKKSFIRMTPVRKVVRYDMGERGKYGYSLDLIPKTSLQIRQETIESARQTSIRWLEKNVVKGAAFHFKIRKFPYHVLRENPLAAGAGADRMSTGMQKAFGKPIGTALQIKKGEKLFTVQVNKPQLEIARKAFARAANKMPCSFTIRITENK